MQVPEAEVDVSSVRLSHTLTLTSDALAKREQCISSVAVLVAALLKEAKKKKEKAPQGEAAGSGDAEASEAVDMEA